MVVIYFRLQSLSSIALNLFQAFHFQALQRRRKKQLTLLLRKADAAFLYLNFCNIVIDALLLQFTSNFRQWIILLLDVRPCIETEKFFSLKSLLKYYSLIHFLAFLFGLRVFTSQVFSSLVLAVFLKYPWVLVEFRRKCR